MPATALIAAESADGAPRSPQHQSDHWLPRIILSGMLALILILLVGMGGYFIYRDHRVFEAKRDEIAAHALSEQEAVLSSETARLGRRIAAHRKNFLPTLRERLKVRVDAAFSVAARMNDVLGERMPAALLEQVIAESLRPINDAAGRGHAFIVDRDGRALVFRADPAREGTVIGALGDDTDRAFVDSMFDIARRPGGGHARFRWQPPGEASVTADAETYVRYFPALGWTIGSMEFVHVAESAQRRGALAMIASRVRQEGHSVLVIGLDGELLSNDGYSGAPGDVEAAPAWPIDRLLALARDGGGTLRFELEATESARRVLHVAYVAPPDEWGWILATVAHMDRLGARIARENEAMKHATRLDLIVTTMTMLAATGIAVLFSVLFYRWIDARFRRYHRDIATRNAALRDSARELHLSAQVFEASNEAIAILDHRFQIVSINPAVEQVTGFQRAELIGRHGSALAGEGDEVCAQWHEAATRLEREARWAGEMSLTRADDSRYFGWVSVGAVSGDAGQPSHFVVTLADISEQKDTERRLRQLAEYDALTGLPNRVLLLDRMSSAIENARRHKDHLAVLFIDLDRFKNINDSLGHAVGDGLLRQVARRLGDIVRASDTVSRLGGDEFVVLLTELDNAARAGSIARKVLKALASAYDVDGHELTITPSIGITVYPEDGENRDLLLKNADAAMYHAKESGRNSYQYFTNELNDRAQLRLELENEMRRALHRHEFHLHYQPQFDLASGALIGAEALLRWNHPERGMIPPDQFIPIAEETGLIVPLGAWILRQACATAQVWRDEGLPEITIAVNISAIQVRRDHLDVTVARVLAETGLPGRLLELELTESALMANQTHVSTTLETIQASGVRLAIDDFGTGYSSLAYLKRFKLDKLKIDRSFIRDLPDDPDDAHLTRAIIGIGHNLDMKVTAEGVETGEQEGFLSQLGCDYAQGYLYAKPLPASAFRQMQIDLSNQAASNPAALIASRSAAGEVASAS